MNPPFISLQKLFPNKKQRYYNKVHSLLTPFPEAVDEIMRRREDIMLVRKVEEYLNQDIPKHFKQSKPICYLSRHIATPNEETLHFIDICNSSELSLPIVIGQDIEDVFSSNNTLKRNLGKLPVIKGLSKNGDPIIENFTVVDFNEVHGKKLRDVKTVEGVSLTDFHSSLFDKKSTQNVEIKDESDWVTRNNRGDLLGHYKKFLALMLVHGIMFELYEDEDEKFVYEILLPAYEYIEDMFGCKPLITHLVAPDREFERNWNGYPSSLYSQVEKFQTVKKLRKK